jgi:lysophospholipase L1-like esterase
MAARASVLRRMIGPLALAAGSVLLTLGVLEVGLRLTTPSHPRLPDPGRVPAGTLELSTVMQLARPNARGVLPGGVPYRANASGFRGPDYARPKPAGVFRIAMIGDSVTMGAGVAEEDAYPARVERALNESSGSVTYEVLNLGMAGLNATNVVERMERIGVPYDPDLIVYGYTLNDIEGPSYRHAAAAPQARAVGALARAEWAQEQLYVVTFLRTRFYSLRELLWPPEDSYVFELDDNYFHNPAALAAVDDAFGRLERLARERGVCVLVLQHTSLWFLRAFHPFRRHYAAVAALARAHGFVDKDTLDYFAGRDALGLWVNAYDSHPNAEGHALLARAALEGLHALPARCWDRH